MKKFISEFKKFITRGNVVDMAVGVIVGSSFTAIVNGLSNNILKPCINWLLAWLFGANSLSEVYTFLTRVETKQDIVNEAGEVIGQETVVDLANSIYIDWGAFINAVINFFLVAFVLFIIVRFTNRFRANHEKMLDELRSKRPSREDRKAMKAQGIKRSDKAAVEAFYAEKARLAAEAKAAAEEQARLDRLANPTTEDLLKDIRELLRKQD